MEKENKENPSLFSAAPFFMIRTPLLPVEDFFYLLNQSNVEECLLTFYFKDEILREAIAIASPNLHQALQKIADKNTKEREQIISSLLKYFLRMATRSTPFGLFACVSHGKWDEKTSVVFDHKNIEKRIRPDMEWLIKIIDSICQHPENFDILPIKANPLALQNGNRINLNYLRINETDKKQKKVSIGATPLTTTILAIAKQSTTVDQLIDKVLELIPGLDRGKIREVVRKLLEQQILVFNLYPSLLTKSPFQDFLAKLAEIQARNVASLDTLNFSILTEISTKNFDYNRQSVGKGEKFLQDIQSSMETLSSSKHFLQVDSTYRAENLTLNSTVIEELEKTAEILWRLSFRNSQHLQNYQAKFLEKYGLGRKIPLLELLSEDGLGIPENYTNPSSDKIELSSREKDWNKWLRREWCQCLHDRKKEITLSNSLIDKILGPSSDKEKAPLSFDLYFEIIAKSNRHIDQGDFLLNIFNNTWQAGSTFGRFIDILGQNIEESLHCLFCKEEDLEENSLFVESSFLPFPSRFANVASHPNLRKYAIDFEGNARQKMIPLEEITVGLFEDRFYLTLNGGNQELIVMAGNVLNPMYTPIPLRFLRDVSRSRYSCMEVFSLKGLENVQFSPRIKYQKSILSPAQWRVDLEQINAAPKEPVKVLEQKFLKWAENWELPQYVFMSQGDNRILLDHQKPEHLREIISILKKNEEVKLVEKIGQQEGEWVNSSRGRHFSEFVVPFLKNKKYQASSKHLYLPKHDRVPSVNRWKLPGSEWLFVKFYLYKERETTFILNHLSRFAKSFQEQGIISGWFFVRYIDHSSHIRVRFRSEKNKILNVLIPALHDWSLLLLQNKLIHDIQIAAYEREIERYGGAEIIELAENFFCADANSAIELMCMITEEKLPLPDFAIAALSLIDLLKGFGLSLQEMFLFLKASVSDQSELKGFRQLKEDLVKLNRSILEDGSHVLQQTFLKRKEAQRLYGEKMLEQHHKGSLSNSLTSIQNSVLHMHCNRLMGNQLHLEKKACLYAFHTLQCFLNQQKMRE